MQDNTRRSDKLLALAGIFILGFLSGFIVSDSLKIKTPRASFPLQSSSQNEIYFSPEGRIRKRLVDLINSSGTSIDIAIFDLTAEPLAEAMRKAQKRGVNVRVVADQRQAKGAHSLIPSLVASGLNVRLRGGGKGGIMHNKFAIFDGKILFTGSYNWTNNAEFRNFENAVFTTDQDAIFAYRKEFESFLER